MDLHCALFYVAKNVVQTWEEKSDNPYAIIYVEKLKTEPCKDFPVALNFKMEKNILIFLWHISTFEAHNFLMKIFFTFRTRKS